MLPHHLLGAMLLAHRERFDRRKTQRELAIERFAPGFRERIVGKTVRSPAQLAAYNPNYVGGDIVTGAKDIRQLVFGPRATLSPYGLGVPGMYLCSAATPPGPGAHGMCGANAAKLALAHLARRA